MCIRDRCQRYGDALRYLEPLRQDRPDYRPEAVALLIARSLAPKPER